MNNIEQEGINILKEFLDLHKNTDEQIESLMEIIERHNKILDKTTIILKDYGNRIIELEYRVRELEKKS